MKPKFHYREKVYYIYENHHFRGKTRILSRVVDFDPNKSSYNYKLFHSFNGASFWANENELEKTFWNKFKDFFKL